MQELCAHPFWQVRLPTLELPPEPALDAFIARFGLAPTVEEMRQSMRDGLKVRLIMMRGKYEVRIATHEQHQVRCLGSARLTRTVLC